jgi:3-dehydroquinate synthetase
MTLTALREELAALPDGVHVDGDTWRVCAGPDRWMVKLTPGLLSESDPRPDWAALASHQLVVTDERVHGLYGKRIAAYLEHYDVRHTFCVVPEGEEAKGVESLGRICAAAQRFGLPTSGLVAVVGGGVPIDLGKLAAYMLRRGTPCATISTTPLAGVDAAIGLKAMINVGTCKNLAGVYAPALANLVVPDLWGTVAEYHQISATAEMAKMGFIRSARLLERLRTLADDRQEIGFDWLSPNAGEIVRLSIRAS